MLTKTRQISNIDVDFLIPNGIILSLNVTTDSSLKDLKDLLAQHATDLLQTKINFDNHIFTSINEEAQTVEFYDLSKKLSDLNLFSEFPFLKLVDNQKDFNLKLFRTELSLYL